MPFIGLVKDQAVAVTGQPIENNTINYLHSALTKRGEDISIYKKIPKIP